jgi:DNA-binding NtrC family response regulator
MEAGNDHEIHAASLPDFQFEAHLQKGTPLNSAPAGASLDERMAALERDLITGILAQNHFSIIRTAEQLKISRHALRYRMHRLNITVTEGDEDTETMAREKPA